MCLFTKLVKNRKYISNKKNGGVIPAITDNRVLLVPVKCGKCIECVKQRAREYYIRLNEDIKEHKNPQFVSLTFSNESIYELAKEIKLEGYERDNKICAEAVRRFCERWRKKYKKSIRHWLVSEIGGGRYEHIHLHGILYTEEIEDIKKIWQYGFVYIGDSVSGKTITYITKYVAKSDPKHPNYKPIVLTSAGIGKNYIDREGKNHKYKAKETRKYYTNNKGYKMNLPTYYTNKLFTDEEREKLWLQLLDEGVRYVNGHKIDVSKNDDEYYKAIEYHRKENKKLGYQDDAKDWDKIRYERDLRNLRFKERTKLFEKIEEEYKPQKYRIVQDDELNIKLINYNATDNIW